jgi:exopolysaccharide production protein ExoY
LPVAGKMNLHPFSLEPGAAKLYMTNATQELLPSMVPGSQTYTVAIPAHGMSHLLTSAAGTANKSANVALGRDGAMAPQPLGGLAKRTLDIAIAVVVIILLSPLIILSMALIRLTMGGPVIFGHSRIGFGGRSFRCYKLRTMVANAEEKLAWHLANDPQAAREWSESRKLMNDPRVTLLGHMLRKSSLDELPQLFNVLRGDMSCVGPRPIVADELQRYSSQSAEYLKARPGLTGMWQISGRNRLDYADRVALDCHYIRNWSIWIDLMILCKTTFAIMKFDETA